MALIRLTVAQLARGEGLEPSTTGPEPAVLPITPPPKGGPDDSSAVAAQQHSGYPSPAGTTMPRALRMRSMTCARSSTASVWGNGGLTAVPVTATRTGWKV